MKKVVKYILSVATILFISVAFSESLLATSCASPSPEHAFRKADVVFAGRVTKVKYLDNPKEVVEPRIIVTFDVSKTWKGPQQEKFIIHTVFNAWSKKGYFFYEENEYLVYAHKQQDETFGVSLCGGTKWFKDAEEDLGVLDKIVLESFSDSTIEVVESNIPANIQKVISRLLANGGIHAPSESLNQDTQSLFAYEKGEEGFGEYLSDGSYNKSYYFTKCKLHMVFYKFNDGRQEYRFYREAVEKK